MWQRLQSPALADQAVQEDLPAISELSPIIDRTGYLPAIAQPIPAEWCGIAPADFQNPNLWAPVGELKSKFKITSERSFWRTLARLKEMGLRTITDRQDKRIKLYYRPQFDQIMAQSATATMRVPTSTSNNSYHNISNNPDQIWQAIAALQQQQQSLLNALNNISPPINSSNPTLEKVAAAPLRLPDK